MPINDTATFLYFIFNGIKELEPLSLTLCEVLCGFVIRALYPRQRSSFGALHPILLDSPVPSQFG